LSSTTMMMTSISLKAVMLALGLCVATAYNPIKIKFSRKAVMAPFHNKKAFKVITGLDNFDEEHVCQVAKAAAAGGATHLDIACSPELVRAVREVTGSSIPICVSGVDPSALADCVGAWADMVEIGNFDSFYEKGVTFSARQVLEMTKETRSLLPYTPMSVTVPHTLSLEDQVKLAEELAEAGADIIQTEGKVSISPSAPGIQGTIEKAAPTIAAASAIAKSVDVPVMAASGISSITAPLALSVGSSGIGVGSAVSKLNSEVEMFAAVRAIAEAMGIAPPPIESDLEVLDAAVRASLKEPLQVV